MQTNRMFWSLVFACQITALVGLPQQFSLNIGFGSSSPQEAPFQLNFHRSEGSPPSLSTSAPLPPTPPPRSAPSSSLSFSRSQEGGNRFSSFSKGNNFQPTKRSFPVTQKTFRRPQNTNQPLRRQGGANTLDRRPEQTENRLESHEEAIRKNALHRKQLADVVAEHQKKTESQIKSHKVQFTKEDKNQISPVTEKEVQNSQNTQVEFKVNKNKNSGAGDVRKFVFVSKKGKDNKKEYQQSYSFPKELNQHLQNIKDLNSQIDNLTLRVNRVLARKKTQKRKKAYEEGRRKTKQSSNNNRENGNESDLNQEQIERKSKRLLPTNKRVPNRNK